MKTILPLIGVALLCGLLAGCSSDPGNEAAGFAAADASVSVSGQASEAPAGEYGSQAGNGYAGQQGASGDYPGAYAQAPVPQPVQDYPAASEAYAGASVASQPESSYPRPSPSVTGDSYPQPTAGGSSRLFYVVSGAVQVGTVSGGIKYQKKCEHCGYVSPGTSTAYGSVKGSFHCPQCREFSHLEIKTESSAAPPAAPAVNLYVVSGAVKVGADSYGIRYQKKCESCGYISPGTGTAASAVSSSYYCPKCHNTSRVIISSDRAAAAPSAKSFYIVSGAVQVGATGYGIKYRKKCENCGYLYPGTSTASSGISTTYHCSRCLGSFKLIIRAE